MANKLFDQSNNGFELSLKKGRISIQVYSENIIHVLYSPIDTFPLIESLIITQKKKGLKFELDTTHQNVSIQTEKILAKIDTVTGAIQFADKDGKILLSENPKNPRTMIRKKVMGEKTWNALQRFVLSEDEALFGLGQYPDGYMNYRGKDVIMVQTNPAAVNPFLVSTRGYGILWDNYSKTIFHDGKDGMSFWSEVADVIDYYFISGENIDEIVSGYRELTGKAPMFGKWAYGYWQSKERYIDSKELIGVAKEYRRRKIPIDNIVQDWRYWGENDEWGSMKFNSAVYPEPEETIRMLHLEYHLHFMISIWPAVGVNTDIYRELKEKNLLFSPEHWTTAFIYDAYSKEAREIYWRHIKEGLISKGVDALWMDATEVELRDQPTPEISEQSIKELGKNALGTMARYLNPYSLMSTKGVYEGFRKDFPEKRVFILTRSVFSGQQRYASATWSGDIPANWNVFRNQISAGVNFCMAGVPYWSHDIGAFFCGIRGGMYPDGCSDAAYRELYVRWFQFGAFTPIFRSHGTETPREVWQFGEKGDWAYDALLKFDNLRYRLLPYIYSLAWKVTDKNYTMMRGLSMDFAQDKNTHNIDNQYMFGPFILVIPVTEEQYFKVNEQTENKQVNVEKAEINPVKKIILDNITNIYEKEIKAVSIYLPECNGWYDFWTGEYFKGSQSIRKETPIDIMPLYVKAGSIIPFGPFKQYADEIPEDPIELRIYPGEDAEFELYEDENDNYNYEKGIFAIIPINWNEKKRTLIIGERQGEFPGMLKVRTFNIVIVSLNHGIGSNICQKPDRTILYDGKEQIIEFNN
jgi:alpha-D-xyloside xylohydrolase